MIFSVQANGKMCFKRGLLFSEQIYLLQDILENEDVKLDHMFIASLVADIVKVCLMNENFKDSLRYIELD